MKLEDFKKIVKDLHNLYEQWYVPTADSNRSSSKLRERITESCMTISLELNSVIEDERGKDQIKIDEALKILSDDLRDYHIGEIIGDSITKFLQEEEKEESINKLISSIKKIKDGDEIINIAFAKAFKNYKDLSKNREEGETLMDLIVSTKASSKKIRDRLSFSDNGDEFQEMFDKVSKKKPPSNTTKPVKTFPMENSNENQL